jgi:hypothetical protein
MRRPQNRSLAVVLALLPLTSIARGDGNHAVRPEAVDLIRRVVNGDVAGARSRVQPYAEVAKLISVNRQEYARRIESILNAGRLADPRTPIDIVIEDVSWQPQTHEIFVRMRPTFSDSGVGDAWRRPVYFHIGKYGWMLVGL